MATLGVRNKPVILIIGTSSNVGLETIKALKKYGLCENYFIRHGVRNVEKAQKNLSRLSQECLDCVEIAHLDLNRVETLEPAFMGVTKVLLILGLHSDRNLHTSRVVEACKKANVEHLAFLSVVGCPSKSLVFFKQFREAEEIIQSSGIVYTFLRTVFFQENLIYYAHWIQQGQLALPIGNGKFAPLSICDFAEVYAKICFDNLSNHAFKIYDLTGPELVDGNMLAILFSKCLGKQVTFYPISFQEGMQHLQSLGFPTWVCQGFMELYEIIAHNQQAIISRDGENLLGKKMRTLEWMINNNKNTFLGTRIQQPFVTEQVRQQQFQAQPFPTQPQFLQQQKQQEYWQQQQLLQQQRQPSLSTAERIWPK